MNKIYKTNRIREMLKPIATLILFMALLFNANAQVNNYLNEAFNSNPLLSATDVNGMWYTDRFTPAAFESFNLNGENVLKISTTTINGRETRPSGYNSTFYNTHGRKINQQGLNVTILKGSLYLPADWATNHRRSDMWATAFNANGTISWYPIIGFRNVNGNTPKLSCYDGNTGLWNEFAIPTVYDTWYNFEIKIIGANIVYFMNGNQVASYDANGSVYIGNVIMQVYNFNDNTLNPISQYNPISEYSAYWDNLITQSNIYNVNQSTYYPTIPAAVSTATANNVIQVTTGTYDFTSQMNINIPVSIIGQGNVIFNANNAAWSTTNGQKHLIGIYAGTSVNPITISNVTMNFNSQCNGLNTYNNAYGILNNVTINGSKGAGLTVNGSTIIATNLTTGTNAWGAVNVDPGSGVTYPSAFTLNSGTLAENTQIWSDGNYVTGSATVTVNATGYNQYKIGNTKIWTNRPLTNCATITKNGETSIYSTIQAAIDAAVAGDVIDVYPGNYYETALNRPVFGVASYQFGLFIDKNNLTIRGVKADGSVITNYSDVATLITTNSIADFGPSGIFVQANNVTLQGLGIGDNIVNNVVSSNKTIEVIGDAFTMNKCVVNTSSDEGALYMGRWDASHPIVSYSITDNLFNNTLVSINNGVGITGSNSGRLITGNTFTGVATPYIIGFRGWNGASPAHGWIVDPVGGAVVTGNTFNNTNVDKYIVARGNAGGYVNSELNWNEIWTSNTYGNKVITLETESPFAVRSYNDGTYPETRKISPVIQDNITNIAQANDVVLVGDGTYSVNINLNKNISLLSVNGAATTIIDGNNSGSELGAIQIPTGMNGITIGSVGHGFTIKGINGNGALEKAAIYLQSTQNNINIIGNIIEARGDAALMGESNATNNQILIDNNQFTGQTFTGSNPSGVGFATQFDVGNNCPRQFVVFGGGASTTNTQNFTFTNNTISGISGGMSITNDAGGAISPAAQGNTMVTLDLVGANTITGNTWSGTTTRYAEALRVRGNGTYTINNNSFTGSFPKFITRSSGATANATCNWYGTTDATTFAAKIEGNLNWSPFLSTSDIVTPSCTGVAPVRNVTKNIPYITISSAITAASANDVIEVAAGTYNEQVNITKAITLLGPNAGVAGTGSRAAEAIIQFPSSVANGSSLIKINSNLHGVTIAGFDLRCQDATLPNYLYLILAYRSSSSDATEKWNNMTIKNNRFYSSEIPVYILTDFDAHGSGLLIEGNYINGGPNVNSSYNRGMYVGGTSGTIQDNTVENCNLGIQYMPYGNPNTGLIRRNTVTASGIGLYHNYQTIGAAPVIWEQNEVSVAPNPQTGLSTQVDGAWTTPTIFCGIHVITFGTQGTGSSPAVTFQNNSINAANPGGTTSTVFRAVYLSNTSAGTVTLSNNSLTNYTAGIVRNSDATTTTINATCNWWGSTSNTIVAAAAASASTYIPWLTDGTDNSSDIGFQPVSGACTGAPVTNVTQNTYYSTIQAAITAANANDVIQVAAGTYNENVIVNKYVSIIGAGNTTIVQGGLGNAFTYTAAGSGTSASSRAYLKNLKVNSSVKGLYVQELVNYLTLDGVTFDGNSSYAIHVNNTSSVMNYWSIINCIFNSNSSAVYVSTAANISNFSVTNSTFTNQLNTAFYVGQSSGTPGGLSNLTLTGNTFTSNGPTNNSAALYIEKLSNGIISGNTMTNNGLSTNPRGIIINLKFGSYSGVTVSGNTIIENRGATMTNGYGINVQGRNDAPLYNSIPGSLTTVSVTNNDISGYMYGIEIDNNVDWNSTTISNNAVANCTYGILGVVTGTGNTANTGTTLNVHQNKITGTTQAVINFNPNSGTINATNNYWGGCPSVSGNVSYFPYFTIVEGTPGSFDFDGSISNIVASSTNSTICAGLSTTIFASGGSNYVWDNGLGLGASKVVGPLVNTIYNVTGNDANGCAGAFDDVVIGVNSAPVVKINGEINGTSTIPSAQQVVLTASGAVSYLWSTGETTASITVYPTSATTYSVVGTTGGCSATATHTITPIIVSAGPNKFICSGDLTTLTATVIGATPASYLWSPGGATTDHIDIAPNTTTVYTVTVTVGGSNPSASVTVFVNSKPIANAGPDITVAPGGTGILTGSASNGTAPYSYSWNTTPVQTTANATVTATANATETYSLVVSDAYGCVSLADNASVTVAATGYTVSGNVAYAYNMVNNQMHNVTVTLKQGGTAMYTTTTPLTGNGDYQILGVANGTYTVHLSSPKPWGGVTSADIIAIQNHYKNANPVLLHGIKRLAADVYANSTSAIVNLDDRTLVNSKRVNPNGVTFTTGNWVFTTTENMARNNAAFVYAEYTNSNGVYTGITLTVNNANKTQDFNALCYGDVDASYTGLKDNENSILDATAVDGLSLINFPNPFSDVTTIQYNMPVEGSAVVDIFDLIGNKVASISDPEKSEGVHNLNFNASGMASGIYIYTVTVKTSDDIIIQNGKMIFSR